MDNTIRHDRIKHKIRSLKIMKIKKHILTLSLILATVVGYGQSFNYQLNYGSIKFGNSATGQHQFNGLANFVNGITIPLRAESDSSSNAASTQWVKRLVQGLGSPLTFSNGLTKTGNNVSLGGDGNWDFPNVAFIGNLTGSNPYIVVDRQGILNSEKGIYLATGNSAIELKTNNLSVGVESNIIDISAIGKGAYYRNKHRSGLTNRSIMDKEYIDSVANAASISGVTSVNGRTGAVTGLAEASSLANYELLANKSTTLTSPSNTTYPTTLAVSNTLSTYQTIANLSTDLTASATKYPNVNAVNTGLALKANLTGGNNFVGAQNIKGVLSVNPATGTYPFIQIADNGNLTAFESATSQIGINGSTGRLAFTRGIYTGTINNPTLTANKTWDLPNKTGTFLLDVDVASGQTIGANTTGMAGSTNNWAGNLYDASVNNANFSFFMGYNGVENKFTYYSASTIKSVLATSLQDVTNVNPVSTSAVSFGSVNGLSITGSGGSLTIPTSSSLIRSGAHALTLTTTDTTNATFPTGSYTLATTSNTATAIKDTNLNITTNQTLAASTWGTSGELTIFANAASGAITITLPTPANMQNLTVNVFKTDSSANVVTVSGGTSNINGAVTFTLTTQYASVEIKSNGTQFYAR